MAPPPTRQHAPGPLRPELDRIHGQPRRVHARLELPSRITRAGYDWSVVGENIATGYATPASVVRGWMASTGHCRNILTPTFAATGLGVSAAAIAHFAGRGTWTEDFGLRIGQRAPSHNWRPSDACPY